MKGIDFDETYAPVSKMTTLRYLMCRAAQEDWEMDQVDVVTTCLNPAIDKEVYMQLPEGIKWLITDPLSSSSSLSPADSTPKSTHNPCAETHSVSRAEERFVETTRMLDGNSQHVSTMPGNSQHVSTTSRNSQRVSTMPSNSQHVSTTPGNSQRVSTTFGNSQCVYMTPGNSQHVSTTTTSDPMAMRIYMNSSLRLNKVLYGLKLAPLL